MQTIGTWANRDKSKWARGEWDNEPDKVHWIDEATDFDCLLHRSSSGAWCGYVGVTEGHPLFGKNYDDADVSVHGGLTFASFCMESEEEGKGICHVPQGNRPHKVWWLGFDCAHSGDLCPSYGQLVSSHEHYKNQAYAQQETSRLAQQLHAISQEKP